MKKIYIPGFLIIFLLMFCWFSLAILPTWDKTTNARIKTLHPKVRGKVRRFINLCALFGYKLKILSAHRTFAQQTDIYNQGRATAGSVVTNAQAGQSYHNYGLAIDVNEVLANGTLSVVNMAKIAKIGKFLGFEWGGHFKSVDPPHFQYTFGKNWSELLAYVNAGKVTDSGYVKLA